jgi:hypothetical protein
MREAIPNVPMREVVATGKRRKEEKKRRQCSTNGEEVGDGAPGWSIAKLANITRERTPTEEVAGSSDENGDNFMDRRDHLCPNPVVGSAFGV